MYDALNIKALRKKLLLRLLYGSSMFFALLLYTASHLHIYIYHFVLIIISLEYVFYLHNIIF